MKETDNHEGENIRLTSRGSGREGFRSRHSGCTNRGRGRNDGQKQSNDQSNTRNVIQCYHCRRMPIKPYCWYKESK